jgi:hypothetical protein
MPLDISEMSCDRQRERDMEKKEIKERTTTDVQKNKEGQKTLTNTQHSCGLS